MFKFFALLALMPYYVLLQSGDFSDPTRFAPIDDTRPKWQSIRNDNVPAFIASAPIMIVTTANTNKPAAKFGAIHIRSQPSNQPFVRANQFFSSQLAADKNNQATRNRKVFVLSSDAPPNVGAPTKTIGSSNDSLPGSRSLFGPFGGNGFAGQFPPPPAQFNNGEGHVQDFDNSAALGFPGGPGGFGGGGVVGAEFSGASPFIAGGFGGGGGFPPPGQFGGLPPNCECRLISDCRDVSILARQLPASGGPSSRMLCLPNFVPCCNEPRPLHPPGGPPIIGGPHPIEPIAPIIRGPPPPPPPIIGGPPPPYVVKDIGCGLKGSNPLARVLDIEATDPKFADAEFGEFPWMTAILRADHTYACGGALIKPRAVVTAAHCVSKLKFEDIIVRLGEYDVESIQELPYQDILVTDVVIHGGYHSGTLANDIAVLILAEPARLSSYIRPVCLPPFHDYLSFKCTVTGWGKNLPNGMFSRILKKVDVPVVDQGFCENEYRKSPELGPFFNLDHSFICAGAPGKDACYGDGGAPLVCEYNGFWRLVGLVSWGIGCGQYPGVYIDITKFVPWIYDVFAKYAFLA